MDRCRPERGTLDEAIAQVSAAKKAFTEDDVFARASRALERAIVNGTTRLRTHVEVDPASACGASTLSGALPMPIDGRRTSRSACFRRKG